MCKNQIELNLIGQDNNAIIITGSCHINELLLVIFTFVCK